MRRFASALAAVSSVCAVVFLLTAVPINALLPTPQHAQLVECQRKAWKDLSACPKNTTYVKDSGELQIALYYDNSSAIILKSGVEYRGECRREQNRLLRRLSSRLLKPCPLCPLRPHRPFPRCPFRGDSRRDGERRSAPYSRVGLRRPKYRRHVDPCHCWRRNQRLRAGRHDP